MPDDDTMVERMARLMHADDVARGRAPEQAWENVTSQMRACYVDNATALLPLVREAQEKALTAFIAEADKSPAITWTGMGGVKELATARAATYRTGDDHE